MKKLKMILAVLILFAASVQMGAQAPKYVFYMIGDGMGINHVYAAQTYNKTMGQPDINFWNFPVRSYVTSYSANSLVTDSSAAGTALASGVKINNNALGIDPEGNKPVTIAEYAKAKGVGAGVVTTAGVNHATPAAFYAHTPSRNQYNEIADQLIASKIDFAGGSTILSSKGATPQDHVDKARQAGINVFCGRDEYKSVKGERVIYLSDNIQRGDLPSAIDQKEGDMKLADFTSAAIDYLYGNFRGKGFFLMVEGGSVDHGGHSNDAATTIHEVIDFAESVELALAFYRQHPNETLIVITSDHETGGFTMGSGLYAMKPEVLASQKLSKEALSAKIADLRRSKNDNVSWNDIKELFKAELGFWDTIPVSKRQEMAFTEVYKTTILDNSAVMDENLYSKNDMLTKAAIDFVNRSAMVTYSFGSHSGAPVPVFAIGAKAENFKDCRDNTDLPKTILKITRWK